MEIIANYKIKNIMGTAHNNKEFRQNRAVALFIYDNICQCCKKHFTDLEVHHDDGNNKNNEILNLIPLCPKDHRMIEKTNFKFNKQKNEIVQLLKFRIIDFL